MTWTVLLVADVEAWFLALDLDTQNAVAAAIDLLEQEGPALRRPLVGEMKGSRIKHLKELRPGSAGSSEVRILFVFDPQRQAVLLVGGDKSGAWKSWYPTAIKVAEVAYDAYLDEQG